MKGQGRRSAPGRFSVENSQGSPFRFRLRPSSPTRRNPGQGEKPPTKPNPACAKSHHLSHLKWVL